jgi:hypothetical protein
MVDLPADLGPLDQARSSETAESNVLDTIARIALQGSARATLRK